MKSGAVIFSILMIINTLFAQQSIDKTIVHNGLTREYRLYIPAAYNSNEAVPLLFNLHGYGSNNAQQDFYGNFKPIADTANFIICLPNGTLDLSNTRYWNVGFFPSNIDDVGFLSTLIDEIKDEYNIDLGRIYSTGMSNGGFMSYSLACKLSDRIAAIASVTGSMTVTQQSDCSPSRVVPVMQIHGTNDPTVPYEGNATFLHIDTLIKKWVERNGCANQPDITNVPDIDNLDGATAQRFDYNDCNVDGEVALYKVANGTHTWPGAILNLGVTCMDFNASLEIWKFFLRYRHPNPLSTAVSNKLKATFSIVPNPAKDFLEISYTDDVIETISVFDISGKKIIETQQTILNIQAIPKGMYFCKVMLQDGGSITKKFLKE